MINNTETFHKKCRVTNINRRINDAKLAKHILKDIYMYNSNSYYHLFLLNELSRNLRSLEYSLYKKNFSKKNLSYI